MRVLQLMASGERGGGADHLAGIVPELTRRGVECVAAVGDNGPLAALLRERGVAVHTIDLMGSRTDPRALLEITRVVVATRPDLVHLHGTRAGFFGALARGGGRWPSVYSAHGLAYRKEKRWLRHLIYAGAEAVACRGATQVVSVSRADLDELERRRLVAPGRGRHIPNAVDHSRFTGDRASARMRLGIGGELVVGTVSRLVAQKAVGDLIDAVARSTTRPRLVVIGDGPERTAVTCRAERAGITVSFAGERDDVPLLLPGFDLFVLSSHWEGEPVALLEAMAAGVPCVATATAGARELLGGGAGVLVPIGDTGALAAAIDRMCADPGSRQTHGRRGRAAVAGRTFAAVAGALVEVYEVCWD